MSYSRYDYDDDEEIDVRVHRRREPSPSPVHYIETRPARPHSYYATGPAPAGAYLVPERTVVTTRSRSRERRSSPPSQAPAPAPVIINNFAGHSSDEESYDERPSGTLVRHMSHHSHHGSKSRAPSSSYMTREEYELEETRRELEELRVQQIRKHDEWELNKTKRELDTIKTTAQRERDDRHREKEYKDYAELSQAKRELDEIRRREERELEEKRIKKELELKKLEEERRKKEEDDRRDKAEKEAVERYKLKEAERMAKEKAAKEYAEKEYQRRLQEDLINAGVHEKDIQAIIKKEKIKEKEKEAKKDRPTYTRMARRHLSIETLRVYGIDYELDQDPDYVIIKRWIPDEEQDVLWRHTRVIREKRAKLVLKIEEKDHHHHHRDKLEPDFEWVRKKERRRSKSPGLLMYLAGAK